MILHLSTKVLVVALPGPVRSEVLSYFLRTSQPRICQFQLCQCIGGLFNILSQNYLLFRRVILRSRTQTRFPVAISFFEDSVYFTDGILMAIKKTNAYASSNATVVALDNGVVNRQPLDIVVSHPLVQTKCKLFSYFFLTYLHLCCILQCLIENHVILNV